MSLNDLTKHQLVTLTVLVVDDSGRPLKADIKGLGGLKEFSSVTSTGTVAKKLKRF